MISVEEALERILRLAQSLPEEEIALFEALGRVLTRPAEARLDQPPFDASAMDGYWVGRADHVAGARLKVIGEAGAGHPFSGAVAAGECLRIFTGAPVPEAQNLKGLPEAQSLNESPEAGGVVVLQEHVARDGAYITLPNALSQNENIRPRGQDFARGDQHFPKRALNPRDLGLMAAMNVARVWVARRPVVAVISTGDELVEVGQEPQAGQIICSNALGLGAFVRACGAELRVLPIARDREESLRAVFAEAQGADVIVTSGGASVGDHDLVGKVAGDLGLERAFWKIAMRPGKPLMAGRMGGAVMLGLPGNPVAALVCAELFLRPLIAHLQGLSLETAALKARLGCALPPEGERQHYQRARLQDGVITPFAKQDSAMMAGMAEADALLIRPPQDPARAQGEEVLYLPLA